MHVWLTCRTRGMSVVVSGVQRSSIIPRPRQCFLNQLPSGWLSRSATRPVPTARCRCSGGCLIGGCSMFDWRDERENRFWDTPAKKMDVECDANRVACLDLRLSLRHACSSLSSERIQGSHPVIPGPRAPKLQPLSEPSSSALVYFLKPQTSKLLPVSSSQFHASRLISSQTPQTPFLRMIRAERAPRTAGKLCYVSFLRL